MSNTNRKTAGIIFFIALAIIGAILALNKNGAVGWTLIVLGVFGLVGVATDLVHKRFQKA